MIFSSFDIKIHSVCCDSLWLDIMEDLVNHLTPQCFPWFANPRCLLQACRGDKKDFGVTISRNALTCLGPLECSIVSVASGQSNIQAGPTTPFTEFVCSPASVSASCCGGNGKWLFRTYTTNSNHHQIAFWSDILLSFPPVMGYGSQCVIELGDGIACFGECYGAVPHSWRLMIFSFEWPCS